VTIANKIKDIVGADVFTNCAGADDFINGAVAEVADLVSDEYLKKYQHGGALEIVDASPGFISVSGKRVLDVHREDSTYNRKCMRVSHMDAISKYTDANSSFKATPLTPVWYLDGANLKIFPAPDDTDRGIVCSFTYPTTAWSGSSDTSFVGMPPELEQSVLLRASLMILQSYISNAVQDDEDVEMQQMLNTQLESLKANYQSEIDRFVKGGAQ
tara:strand:+ start:1065 stop:1706 length:642 start_codon:yes stop_codon:yes gene_type:complete